MVMFHSVLIDPIAIIPVIDGYHNSYCIHGWISEVKFHFFWLTRFFPLLRHAVLYVFYFSFTCVIRFNFEASYNNIPHANTYKYQ